MKRLSVAVAMCALTLLSASSLAQRGADTAALVSVAGIANSHEEIAALRRSYARPSEIPFPEHNPFSEEKRRLGHALYFDPRLSKSGTMSCASCHNPALEWQDGLALGRGHNGNMLPRHSPTLLDIAWAPLLFWDGRADSLEDQVAGPLLSNAEMGMSEKLVLERINAAAEYKGMFTAAFPGQEISMKTIAAAIATFERTIVSARAPFDHWVDGDERAISDSAKRGFVVFNKKANCGACHSGWRFTDDGFHDVGLPDKDIGRGKVVVGVAELMHAFKTPTLRNIDRRGPYMHDGCLATLADVIRHYEGGFVKRQSLAPEMQPFTLSDQERADLLAFLKTLTSEDPPVTIPVLPN
jgi:cytochrome c peroxidase